MPDDTPREFAEFACYWCGTRARACVRCVTTIGVDPGTGLPPDWALTPDYQHLTAAEVKEGFADLVLTGRLLTGQPFAAEAWDRLTARGLCDVCTRVPFGLEPSSARHDRLAREGGGCRPDGPRYG